MVRLLLGSIGGGDFSAPQPTSAMALYKAEVPGVEVNGEAVFSIVHGMGAYREKALEVLKRHGIYNPSPGEWYPMQFWLDSFREIAECIGPNTLFLIGLKVPDSARWPAGIDSIETALRSIDIAYHMNHRLGGKPMFDPATGEMQEGIGHYKSLPVRERLWKIVCDNPYPCDFDRGIITAMVRKYRPPSSVVTRVEHDVAAGCRKAMGESCTYVVEWH